ncbi:hypothetical protein JCM10213_008130 [Rhodosporidiobolus nylandii]
MWLKLMNRSKSFLSVDYDSPSPRSTPPTTPGLNSSSSNEAASFSSGEVSPGMRLVAVPHDPFFTPEPASPFSSSFGGADEGKAFGSFAEQGRLKVLIVGTGFSGLSAAIACARQGFSVTVLERTAGLSVHGDAITFGVNASVLLHRWGVGQEMYERGGSKGGCWLFKDKAGAPLHAEDVGSFKEQYGAPLLQGRRATFLGAMGTEARLLGINIRLEADVIAYLDSEDEPGVVLRTGEKLTGDVIIVADGVHSPARDLLAPHDRPPAPRVPSGYSIHRAAVPSTTLRQDKQCCHLLDGTIRTWLAPDAHCCTYPMDDGRSLAFTFTHRDPATGASLNWRDKRSMEDVLELLGEDWDPVLLRALKHFQTALHWPVLQETPAEEWISAGGKIAFIGDAVHAMQPTSFQGGSQAVEDGATVALCLAMAGGDSLGVGVALQAYEALRRPRVGEAQKLGRKQQEIWHHYASSAASSPSPNLRLPLCTPLGTTNHPLRPLSFSLYHHDAEHFALQNFPSFVAAIDPSFRVRARWISEAARKAELDLSPQRQEGGRWRGTTGRRRPAPAK